MHNLHALSAEKRSREKDTGTSYTPLKIYTYAPLKFSLKTCGATAGTFITNCAKTDIWGKTVQDEK